MVLLLNQPRLDRQFGIQYGGSSRSPNGIVAQYDVLEVKQRTLPDPSHNSAHSTISFNVPPWLGAVFLPHHDHRLSGCRGKTLDLLGSPKFLPAANGFFHRSLFLECERHALQVAFFYRNSIGMGAHGKVSRLESPFLDSSQNLLGFRFNLVFFSRYLGIDVSQDIDGGFTGIAGSRNGLEGHHMHALQLKPLVKRANREGQDNG